MNEGAKRGFSGGKKTDVRKKKRGNHYPSNHLPVKKKKTLDSMKKKKSFARGKKAIPLRPGAKDR